MGVRVGGGNLGCMGWGCRERWLLWLRSAASLPMEAMFLCPVWDFMCLRIVAGGQPGGECAALCLMADAMARMYGRAAHLREEHVSGWWMCLCTAWMVLLESVCIVMERGERAVYC